ncbi:MAG: lamin tail domain-containing protein, partial [Phycisphaeraceae bacterium]
MRKIASIALAAAVLLVGSGPVSGQVLISEVMYNPDSYEGGIGKDAKPNQTEWVELYNAGDKAVSLAGFYLQDEDGRTEPLPSSAKIEPGQAIVLIPGTQSVSDFQKA